MKINPGKLLGSYIIELEQFNDERGSFARQFCKQELAKFNIDFDIKQCNISKNTQKGTLRGMHYQQNPYPEIKIVSCLSGSCFDVIVDLRKNSPTYLQHETNILSEENNKLIYIPAGVAHGFLTLEDNTTLFYQLGEYFYPKYYSGVRYNDPAFKIKWPETKTLIINERDKNYELWK